MFPALQRWVLLGRNERMPHTKTQYSTESILEAEVDVTFGLYTRAALDVSSDARQRKHVLAVLLQRMERAQHSACARLHSERRGKRLEEWTKAHRKSIDEDPWKKMKAHKGVWRAGAEHIMAIESVPNVHQRQIGVCQLQREGSECR